ncbi:MAG TPA: hypothetical protein VHR42_02355 [Clostridia bacterium]|nr:hypothetical protein [Clostridia bacterium]
MLQDTEEIQKLVEQLDGVTAAKIVVGSQGQMTEIHILADRSKSPKQLSRDIQSAITAATGVCVEHKIISIAQVGREALKQAPRLKIENVEISSGVDGFSAKVTLAADHKQYVGSANGLSTAAGRYNTVSKACLNAVQEYSAACAFYVSDVIKIRIANTDEINVAISYFDKDIEKILTGAALVKNDEYYGIVRATLNAVNRVIPVLS